MLAVWGMGSNNRWTRELFALAVISALTGALLGWRFYSIWRARTQYLADRRDVVLRALKKEVPKPEPGRLHL